MQKIESARPFQEFGSMNIYKADQPMANEVSGIQPKIAGSRSLSVALGGVGGEELKYFFPEQAITIGKYSG